MSEIQLPPYPATVDDAKRQANDLAYGFEKHSGDYWNNLYTQDPEYAWKRMLGWQAEGGPDAALFGLYATPPSPWHGTVTPPIVPPPSELPADLAARLDALDKAIAEVRGLIIAVSQKPPPDYKGDGTVPYFGRVTFTLKPQ